MTSRGRYDKPFLIGFFSCLAIGLFVLGAWVTLVRFGQNPEGYVLTAVPALASGFFTVWYGRLRRGIAIAGMVDIFAMFLLLSAFRSELGFYQYVWLLSVLSGGDLARAEFPWAARSIARAAEQLPDGLVLIAD